MPALPVAPDTIKVEFNFTVGTDLTAVVIQHVRYAGGPPSATVLNELCADLRTSVHTVMSEVMNEGTVWTGSVMTDLASDTGAQGTNTESTTGALTNDPLSGATAALVSFPIGRRYRGGKPRSYWPFGDGGSLQDQQHWTSEFVTAVDTFEATLQAFYAAGAEGGTTLVEQVNVSYYEPPNVVTTNPLTGRAKTTSTRRTAALIDPITTFAVSPVLASQRRRVRKVR